MTQETTKCGVVAVLGAPNAGKSTLVNQLVGQKVAITSAKAQTTRARMMGIALHGDTQMILVDTPGIFAPKRRLDRAMVSAAWEGAEAADALLLLVDPLKQRLTDPEGSVIPISTAEFRMLRAFLDHPRAVLDRDRLLDMVQGREAHLFDRAVDNQVSRLRRKIEIGAEMLEPTGVPDDRIALARSGVTSPLPSTHSARAASRRTRASPSRSSACSASRRPRLARSSTRKRPDWAKASIRLACNWRRTSAAGRVVSPRVYSSASLVNGATTMAGRW